MRLGWAAVRQRSSVGASLRGGGNFCLVGTGMVVVCHYLVSGVSLYYLILPQAIIGANYPRIDSSNGGNLLFLISPSLFDEPLTIFIYLSHSSRYLYSQTMESEIQHYLPFSLLLLHRQIIIYCGVSISLEVKYGTH